MISHSQRRWLVWLLLGAAAIVLTTVGPAITKPKGLWAAAATSLCMVLYLVCEFFKDKQAFTDRSPVREEVGDRCYYMGFMFTLLAVLVQLSGGMLSAEQIYPIIGIAFITTIVGLVIRNLLTNPSAHTLADIETEIVDGLRKHAHALKDALEKPMKELSDITKDYGKNVRLVLEYSGEVARVLKSPDKDQKAIGEQLQELVEAMGAMTEIVTKLTAVANGAQKPVEQVAQGVEKLGETSSATGPLVSNVAGAVQNLGGAADGTQQPVDGVAESVSTLGDNSQTAKEHTGRVASDIGTLAEGAKLAGETIPVATETLNALANQATESKQPVEELTHSAGNLGSAASSAKIPVAEVAGSVSQLATSSQKTQGPIKSISADMGVLATNADTAEKPLGKTAELLKTLAGEAETAKGEVVEVADAVNALGSSSRNARQPVAEAASSVNQLAESSATAQPPVARIARDISQIDLAKISEHIGQIQEPLSVIVKSIEALSKVLQGTDQPVKILDASITTFQNTVSRNPAEIQQLTTALTELRQLIPQLADALKESQKSRSWWKR